MSQAHPYHHGNLRVALVDAARDLAAQRGVDGVTLRAVARAAGVSHTAAYHHFSNKAALLDAVTSRCFAEFRDRLSAARDSVDGSARDKLQAVGRAYLHFALERPHDFDLMTRHVVDGGGGGPDGTAAPDAPDAPAAPAAPAASAVSVDLLTESAAAAAVLIDLIQEAQDNGELPPGPRQRYIITHWVAVHGLAVLMRDRAAGRIFGLPLGEGEPDELYDLGFSAFWC